MIVRVITRSLAHVGDVINQTLNAPSNLYGHWAPDERLLRVLARFGFDRFRDLHRCFSDFRDPGGFQSTELAVVCGGHPPRNAGGGLDELHGFHVEFLPYLDSYSTLPRTSQAGHCLGASRPLPTTAMRSRNERVYSWNTRRAAPIAASIWPIARLRNPSAYPLSSSRAISARAFLIYCKAS